MRLNLALGISLITLGVFLVSFAFVFFRLNSLEQKIASVRTPSIPTTFQTASPAPSKEKDEILQTKCGVDCETKISEKVSEAVATISGETKIIERVETKVPSTSGQQTAYVPLGTTTTTTSTDWVDVADSKVYINLVNDYGESATVSWEGSLKVAHGNGQAFARLFDETHGIAVDGSEISTTDNSDYKTVSTGDLAFWRGLNLYKVQVKSLNSFEVTYSGGKIKVRY